MIHIKQYRENCKAWDEGTWVQAEHADGWNFQIRRVGTPQAHSEMKEIRLSLYGPMPKDEYEPEIIAHWLAKYGVTDWENDQDIPYSKANALTLFVNQEYWMSLNLELYNLAANFKVFLDEYTKEDMEPLKKR